jgi:aryl-alcohol dehydrogenase (NADP+)
MTFGAQVNEAEATAILDMASGSGVNFIDTANVYPLGVAHHDKGETERILGRWLKGKRERFILATKCASPMGPLPWDGGTSRKHILAAIDSSLYRLQCDYVDLYQLHRDDPNIAIDETLEALSTIVRSGRARYVGVSNFTAWRIARALGRSEALGLVKYVSVQPRYNLLFREFERELFPMCQSENLATLCYNPLAGGLLSGKHPDMASPDALSRFGSGKAAATYRDRYWHEREFRAVAEILSVADEVGIAPARLAVAWVLAKPWVSCAIIGATKTDQLHQIIAAADTVLDAAVLTKLDRITAKFRLGDSSR